MSNVDVIVIGSGTAVADGLQITGALVTEVALAGDEVARMVLGQIGRHLGVGLANIVNVFNPEAVVVCGGVTLAGDHLFVPLRREVARRPAMLDHKIKIEAVLQVELSTVWSMKP